MCSPLDRYPIIPSFQDWEFPHNCIPDSWSQVSTSPSTRRCAISNFSFAIDGAHLISHEEALWYQRNDIRRYEDAVLIQPISYRSRPIYTDVLIMNDLLSSQRL